MGQGLVQAVSGSANMVASGQTCSVANSAAPHALSDFILAIVVQGALVAGGGFSSVGSVQDIANGPYTYLTSITGSLGIIRHSLYYCQNINTCPQNGNLITVNLSAPSLNIYVRFVEFSGVVISGLPVDIATSSSLTSTNNVPIIGPINTLSANDLIFACCSVAPGNNPAMGAGTGWTPANVDSMGSIDEFILNALIGSYTGKFTGPNPNAWVSTIVGLLNAGPGNTQLATVNIGAGMHLPLSSKLVYGGVAPVNPKISVNPTARVITSAIVNI